MPKRTRSASGLRRALVFIACSAVACTTGEVSRSGADPSATRPLRAVARLDTDSAFAQEVREAFLHAWRGYRTHAWGHDELRPLSRSWRDWYGVTFLMTPVDAYDTMLLMGLEEEAVEAKDLILEHISFDHDAPVQVFEITIRILGGLLSAYQLDGDPRWLESAVALADRMMPAFDSPTGMPYGRVNLATGVASDPVNNPAEIGTLTLEFCLLSDLTGARRYCQAVTRGVRELFARRSDLGLVGTAVDVETGEWVNGESHVGGRIDSYYEYLLKSWLLFGDEESGEMWESSRRALAEHVADDSEPTGRWYGVVDMTTGIRVATTFGALQAFMPGMLALGGDLAAADRIMESVYRMWTEFGVEPESFDYASMEILSPGYILRPEAIESTYVLFMLTGDERYRAMGRDIFRRLVDATRSEVGFAHLADIRTGEKKDEMQSFFLAETLKYAYLLADPAALDFDGVVFNTEAHPLMPVPR